jgi:hypothetical protein
VIDDSPARLPKILSIAPDTEDYMALRELMDAQNKPMPRYPYEVVQAVYNASEIGCLLLLRDSAHMRKQNIIRVLAGRGLQYEIDYELICPLKDMFRRTIPKRDRHYLMKKLTSQPILTLQED